MENDRAKLQQNGISIPLTWTMFGGSTFVLFLLCYFCQRKLQVEDFASSRNYHSSPREVYVIPRTDGDGVNVTYPSMPSPPPEYKTVGKKKMPVFQYDVDPPSYDTVVSGFPQPIFIEENSPTLEKQGDCSNTTPKK